jgi:hypothetical protein
VTTDTLYAHLRAYRAGTISLKDHADMVEELVTRRERLHEALDEVEKRFDKMRDEFVQSIEGDE